MNTSTYRLFVYGSLRSGFRNPAYQYLTQYFTLLGEAVVKGRFYDNGSFPVAVPAREELYIHGELYEVKNSSEFSWVMEQLDDYEGLNVEAGNKPLYRREITFAFQEGQSVETWIYWYNGDISPMKEITTGDVMKYLQQKNKPE